MAEHSTGAVDELREYVNEHGDEVAEAIGMEDPDTYIQLCEKIQDRGYDALDEEERQQFAETTQTIYQTLDDKLDQLDQVDDEYGPEETPDRDISEIREEFEQDKEAFTAIPGMDEEDYETMRNIMKLGEQLEEPMEQIQEQNERRRQALEDAHSATEELMDEYDLRHDAG